MASSTFQTVAALLLLVAAASARLVGPTARHGRSAFDTLRGGAGETQLANVDALPFREALPWLRHVRTHGILQFLAIHDERKDESTDELCWGDEIEYQLVWLDEEEKKCRVCLRAPEVLAEIQEKEGKLGRRDGFGEAAAWHPEYGAWMLEGTPRVPYGGCALGLGHTRLERGAHGPARAAQPALLAPPATAGTPPTSAASRRTCGCVASGSSRSSAATSAP